MTIRQGRYIVAETEQEKKVRVTETQRAEEDPFIRRSEVQQKVNNSTLPVSSRAVKLAIESIEPPSLDGYATEEYVDAKVADIKPVDITQELGQSTTKVISQKIVTDELGKKWEVQETVGNSNGRVMREGAYGLGLKTTHPSNVSITDNTGFSYYLRGNNEQGSPLGVAGPLIVHNIAARGFTFGARGKKVSMQTFGEQNDPIFDFYHTANTYIDKNGYLNNSDNPIPTLTTSDMADTVVNREDITVTSGAVFRAIKQLTDQIISLEARVRELEDGGV